MFHWSLTIICWRNHPVSANVIPYWRFPFSTFCMPFKFYFVFLLISYYSMFGHFYVICLVHEKTAKPLWEMDQNHSATLSHLLELLSNTRNSKCWWRCDGKRTLMQWSEGKLANMENTMVFPQITIETTM